MAGPSPRAGAFTLIELLIAIAILGVGIAMAAAMLPAGILANQHSSKDLMGTLICQNGLAIAKATLTHSISPSHEPVGNGPDLVDITDKIADADNTHYPVGTEDKSGFKLLGRRIGDNENIYQLAAVSYTRTTAGGAVTLQRVGTTAIDVDAKTVTFSNMNWVQAGTPVIVASTGSFARVLKMLDANTAQLDVALRGSDGDDVWVIHEDGAARSPGLTALTTITPLN